MEVRLASFPLVELSAVLRVHLRHARSDHLVRVAVRVGLGLGLGLGPGLGLAFLPLQATQQLARLSHVWPPPRLHATTWSTVVAGAPQ